MSALNPNNPNGGGKGESFKFVSGTNAPTGGFDKNQSEAAKVDPGHGAVAAPNPKHGGKPGYLS